MTGIICSPRLYNYKGIVFEVHSYCGPHPLKKNMEPRKIIPKSFWVLWDEFRKLPEIEQEHYRIGGGCIRIEENNLHIDIKEYVDRPEITPVIVVQPNADDYIVGMYYKGTRVFKSMKKNVWVNMYMFREFIQGMYTELLAKYLKGNFK